MTNDYQWWEVLGNNVSPADLIDGYKIHGQGRTFADYLRSEYVAAAEANNYANDENPNLFNWDTFAEKIERELTEVDNGR